MQKVVLEIYQGLLGKGFKEEELINKMLTIGDLIVKQAQVEEKRELVDLGLEIFKYAAGLAKTQKLYELSGRAEELAIQHNKLKLKLSHAR
jgi:hypothetical protein